MAATLTPAYYRSNDWPSDSRMMLWAGRNSMSATLRWSFVTSRQPICPVSIRSAEIASLRAARQLHSQFPAKAVRQRNRGT